jgi:RNA polymerase sigma-70 factor (ECF subfamily)
VAPSVPTPPTPRTSTGAAESASPPGGFARLERFWNDHSETIFRAAYRITGNPADAEDVLQTVFLRLARRAGEGGDSGGRGIDEREAGGYLHRSAVNAALDVVRSRQRAGWVPLEPAVVGAGVADTHASSAPDPERDQANRELRANLRLAIARLSPRSAEIFALRYFEGLTNREIASLMGTSQGLVAVLLHRTRARLRKELAALEGVVR